MKVLIVASYNKGHFAPFIIEQVEAMHKTGVECNYFGIEGKGIKGYVKNLSALKKKIKEFQPDIIHAHYGLSGLLSNLQRRIPVVTTYHGSDINDPKVLPLSKLSMCLSRFNIFVSQKQIDVVRAKRKYALIPCGINLDDSPSVSKTEARKRMGLDENRKYILFAGAFDNKVKNYPLAKESVGLLNDEVTLLELKGYSREEVALLMNAADVLLMTSFTEGSPQVIKEAMACGCPIVSTDVGDVKQVFGKVSGCYICSYDPKDVAEKLVPVLNSDERTEGRNRILFLGLTNENVAVQISQVYDSVLRHSI